MAAKYTQYIGPHLSDLTALQGKLYDVEAGGTRGMRPDLEGFPTVALELEQSVANYGAAAGVPQDVYDHFVMCNDIVETIDEKLAVHDKQGEVLCESRAFYVDARQNDVGLIVDSIKSRAQRRKDPSILMPFEKTIQYNGQIGDEANKTRKQNLAKAQAEAEAEAAEVEEASAAAEGDAAADAIAAYKAELEAKFEQAVKEAVEKKLAEMKAASVA